MANAADTSAVLQKGERKQSVCPGCGRTFDMIGSHWAQATDCFRPAYTDRQREVLKGLVMGDGSLNRSGDSEFSMVVMSTQARFLQHLDALFGPLSAGVRMHQDGETIAAGARKSGFDTSEGSWEYKDVYAVRIRGHPTLTEMRNRWYPDGQIRYPSDLVLTPTAAKMWYCSDGGLSWARRPYVAFGTHNEAGRPEFLKALFEEHGFDPVWSDPLLRFTNDDTGDVLDWMGDPIPGFEYKWVYQSRGRYDAVKTEVVPNA